MSAAKRSGVSSMPSRACSLGDHAGRQRRAAGGRGVALQDENLGATLVRGKRRGQAAGPGTDHDDRDLDIEDGFGGGQDRHG
jgi:hypothetical protein